MSVLTFSVDCDYNRQVFLLNPRRHIRSARHIRWCGEIGRRKGLKIPRWQHRTGSNPVTSTKKYTSERMCIFLSKPTGLVYHHAARVYIIAEHSSAYIITP